MSNHPPPTTDHDGSDVGDGSNTEWFMTVVTLRLDLRVDLCHSARERRMLLQAILEKLHKHFNVSVAEADGEGGVDRAVLLAAAVGKSRKEARQTLERVADAVSAHPRAQILSHAIHEV